MSEIGDDEFAIELSRFPRHPTRGAILGSMKLLLENVWTAPGIERLQVRGFERPDWVIYGLAHPLEGSIRYVGKTLWPPTRRFKRHLSQTIKENTHCGRWLRKLRQDGLEPVMCILKHGWGDGWEQEERKWINGPWSAALTNHAAGGEGVDFSGPNGQASREKMSAAAKSEQRLAQLRRMQNDPAVQERRMAAVMKSKQNPEWRERMKAILAEANADPKNLTKKRQRGRSKENLARLKQMAIDCGKWHPSDTLHVIADRRFGSQMRAHIFRLIRDGMTVQELLDACAPFGYDTRHYLGKFINVYCCVEVRKTTA